MTVGRITLLQHHSWIDCIPRQSTRLLLSFQDKMRYFFSLQDRAAFFNREVRLVKRKIKLSFSKYVTVIEYFLKAKMIPWFIYRDLNIKHTKEEKELNRKI